ncbi:unnamed protein product [Sphenostylis stenocarpa]|uniref:Uncharacterized protein n=1 Tax=Sphenostylis stenocarpa TaxID=92480 RepID=A0AA86TBM8_9FABA|nr:unnamed protein product [Sphenostylis stenocarpa]
MEMRYVYGTLFPAHVGQTHHPCLLLYHTMYRKNSTGRRKQKAFGGSATLGLGSMVSKVH